MGGGCLFRVERGNSKKFGGTQAKISSMSASQVAQW